jgi:hypothetical protein
MSFYVFTPQFREDILKIMSLLQQLQAGYQQLGTDITACTTAVEAKVAADAAALAAASANSVTQADVDAITALQTQVTALTTSVS